MQDLISIHDRGYIHVAPAALTSPSRQSESICRVAMIGAATGIRHVVVDMRNVIRIPDLDVLHELSARAAKRVPGIRVAVLAAPHFMDTVTAVATMESGLGARLKVFPNCRTALAWLHE